MPPEPKPTALRTNGAAATAAGTAAVAAAPTFYVSQMSCLNG